MRNRALAAALAAVAVAAVAAYAIGTLVWREEAKEILVRLPGGARAEVREVAEGFALPKTWKPLTKVYEVTCPEPLAGVARVALRYDPSKLRDVDPDTLVVLTWVEEANGFGYWVPLPSRVFRENHTVVAEVTHFSKLALFARLRGVSYRGVADAIRELLERPPTKPDCVVGFLLLVDKVVVSEATHPSEFPEIMDVIEEMAAPYLVRVGGLRFMRTLPGTDKVIVMVGCKADLWDGWDQRGCLYDFGKQKILRTMNATKLSAELLTCDISVCWFFDCGDDAEVMGVVVTEEGEPVAGALVIATDPLGKTYRAMTDDSGYYSMKVRTGLYRFRVEGECVSGWAEKLVCAYGCLGEDRRIKPTPSEFKARKTEVNIVVKSVKYIEILVDVTITASGVRQSGVMTYRYSTVVREVYNLTFTYEVVNQTADGYKYFEGRGVIRIEYYSVDADSTLECRGRAVYMRVDMSYSGSFSQEREVVVSGWISPSDELIDINVTIAGAPPNTLFCEPDAGTVHVHMLIETPQTRSESEQSRSYTPTMYPRDVEVVVEAVRPHIRVYGGEQRREVSFELNTNDYFMCMTKGILGGALTGIELPQGVTPPSLGEVTFKFAGTLTATTCPRGG